MQEPDSLARELENGAIEPASARARQSAAQSGLTGPVEQFAALASAPPSALGDPHLLAVTTRALVEFERLRIERDTWMLIAEERELALRRAHDALDAVDGILAPAMGRSARWSSTADRRPLGRSARDRRRAPDQTPRPKWEGRSGPDPAPPPAASDQPIEPASASRRSSE